MDTQSRRDSAVEVRYRKLVDNLPSSVVFVLDHNLSVTFAGGGLMTKFAFHPELYLHHSVRDFLPPAVAAFVEPYLYATLAGQEISFELVYPSGGVFQVCTTPLQDDDEGSAEILVIALDITQRRRSEQARAESERFASATLDALTGHIAIVDATGTITAVNRAWRDFAYANQARALSPSAAASAAANCCEGANYLAVCQAAAAAGCDEAQLCLEAMRAVLAGDIAVATQVYACHSPDEQRWFVFRITRFPIEDPPRLVVAHENITTRKLAELALAEREARYRSLFEDNHTIMVLVDRASGEIVDVNPAAAAYYGWSREEMRAMSAFDVHVPSQAEVRAEILQAEAEGRHFYRFKQRRADGSVRDLEAYSSPVELDGRQLHYVIMHDVTQRNAAGQALRQSEAALRRSQAVAHIGHWTWDAQAKELSFSDETKHILGLDPATSVGNLDATLRRAIHPDDLDRARALRRSLSRDQEPAGAEFRVVWPDGSIHYIWIMAEGPERDSDGNLLRQTGIMQDITERKLRELENEQLLRQLQSTAEQLAQVVDSAPDAVLLLNNLGSVLLTNPKADTFLCQQAVYDEEGRLRQLAGTAWEELQAAPPPGHWHTLRAGQQVFEAIARPADTGLVTAGWVIIVRDVTVERAVREQMQRQERLAAVGQLAAGIAHDFNNIMSVISVYAEMTSEAPGLTDKERARMLTVMEQTQRAARMIRQILDFSRQAVYERQVLDLLPLLKEEAKLLRQTLPESIEIRLDYTPGDYIVLADPTRIQQLIMNLAVNARDAMPEGGVFGIALARSTLGPSGPAVMPGIAAGEWVQIVVSDTGTGMAPDHLGHIFEPFFTTKEPGKGTGLGLAQVHGIVAQHEGHIAVTSKPGAGTIFTIYLPAAALGVPPRMSHEEALPAQSLPQGHGECVLLVEDDGDVRSSLATLLEEWNYQVVQAANGEEALVCLARPEQRVNVILSDVVMPRLGGIGLVKALRKDGVDTPVILMSGYAAGEARTGLPDAGVTAWLDKPPSSAALAAALADAVMSP